MPNTPELWRGTQLANQTSGSASLSNDEYNPRVTQLANGNLLFAWTSSSGTGGTGPGGPELNDIIGVIYDPLGNLIQGEFRLNDVVTGGVGGQQNLVQQFSEVEFDIAAKDDGGFVLVYISRESTDERELEMIDWSADLQSSVYTKLELDGTDSQFFSEPSVVVNGDIVTYSYVSNDADFDGIGGDDDVIVGTYNLSTTVKTSELVLNSNEGAGEGQGGHAIALLSNGNTVTVYSNLNEAPSDDEINFDIRSPSNVFVASFNVTSGTTGAGVFDYNRDPDIAAFDGGGFVVAWVTDATDLSGNSGIRHRVYANDGSPVSGIVASAPLAGNQWAPAVAALNDGTFIIAFYDVSSNDIRFNRFDSDGVTQLGTTVNVDTNVPFVPDIQIETLEDGRFVITYTDGAQDGTFFGFPTYDFDVEFKIYDPRDLPNTSDPASTTKQVIGTTFNDFINDSPASLELFGWEGADAFVFDGALDLTNDVHIVDGGTGFDKLTVSTTSGNRVYDFRDDVIRSIEELEFDRAGGVFQTEVIVRFDAASFSSTGISSLLHVDGFNVINDDDQIEVYMNSYTDGSTTFSAAGWTFQDWGAADQNDKISIFGGILNDHVTGSSQNDRIVTSFGADTLIGGGGNDILEGGQGGDIYYVDTAGDLIVELDAEGYDLMYISGNNVTMGDYVEQAVMVEGSAAVNMNGGNISNLITGNSAGNFITVGGGSNLVYAGAGDDQIVGGAVSDLLDGREDNDGILGMAGSDILFGGIGNDTLDGGADNDAMYGDFGDDTYYRDNAADQIIEGVGAGNDLVYSAIEYALEDNVENAILQEIANNSSLSGNALGNALTGNSQANILFGGAGSDILAGGGGADTLNGGADFDALYGGAGGDMFVLTNDNLFGPADLIGDFEANGTDKIVLQGDFGALGPTVQVSELRFGSAALDANDYLLFDSTTGTLRYDADGNGGFGAVDIATITLANGTIDASDFEIG